MAFLHGLKLAPSGWPVAALGDRGYLCRAVFVSEAAPAPSGDLPGCDSQWADTDDGLPTAPHADSV
jgi:hypothetical protein